MTDTIHVQTASWMELLTAVDGKKYYLIGRIMDKPNTLAVTEKGGNGGTVFYCQTHRFAYPHHGRCEECQKQVVEAVYQASVTACNTPEI